MNKAHFKKEIRISTNNFIITDSILNELKNLTKHIKNIFLKITDGQQIYRFAFHYSEKKKETTIFITGKLHLSETSHWITRPKQQDTANLLGTEEAIDQQVRGCGRGD